MKKIQILLEDKKFCHGCPLCYSNLSPEPAYPWSKYIIQHGNFRVVENTCALGYRTKLIVDGKDKTKINMVLRDEQCIKEDWILKLK